MRRFVLLAAIAGSLAACGPSYIYSSSGAGAGASRGADCTVEVLTTPPSRAFVEVGTFEADDGEAALSISALRDALRERACGIGADALVVVSNDTYQRVTAIRWADGVATP